MRCPINESSDLEFQVYMDIYDPGDFSTNYLQRLCFWVRHVDRVTFFMGSFGGPALTHEQVTYFEHILTTILDC